MRYTLIAVFSIVLPLSAESFRPLKTQSSKTLTAGELELDVAIDYRHDINFPFDFLVLGMPDREEFSIPRIELDVGIAENLELQFVYEYLSIDESGPLRSVAGVTTELKQQSGSGDARFFTKWRFLDQEGWLPDLALRMGAKLPNADNKKRLGTDKADIFLDLIIGRHYEKFSTSFNIGIGVLDNPRLVGPPQDDVMTYGVAIIYKVTEKFDIAGEVNGVVSDDSLNELSTLMGAFRYHWKSLRFYVGLSTGLVDRSEDVGAVVGVTWMK
ncbi:MAG: hypothetical protein QF886_00005 [Planctomycetota bacterium]|nr:hypothetical protein [Planctomycetota bacterium]